MNKLPALPLDLDNSPARMSIHIKAGELATQMRRWGHAVYAAAQQAAPEAHYRVAEFWSSVNPGKKVRMLAEGSDIVEWAKRSDFIRWADAHIVAPEAPLEYRTCCDHPDCTTCAGLGGFYRRAPLPDAPLSNAEFLAKRLGRVAKLTGVTMPGGTYEQIAEVAGTILGEIARALETRATQIKQWQQRAWENGCDTELQPDPKHYTNEMQAEIRDLRAALAPSKGDNLDR